MEDKYRCKELFGAPRNFVLENYFYEMRCCIQCLQLAPKRVSFQAENALVNNTLEEDLTQFKELRSKLPQNCQVLNVKLFEEYEE
ncbi:hypothetical protein AB6A40_007350 [Gnathostoma spinigerum]|uniref:Uncharacterized protein n=1 Tax=Gnathostoma spinigerum TaxID=75299 RepID=A0ABD6EMY9_9BILA